MFRDTFVVTLLLVGVLACHNVMLVCDCFVLVSLCYMPVVLFIMILTVHRVLM